MFESNWPLLTRRAFMASATAAATTPLLPFASARPTYAATIREFVLQAAPGEANLFPESHGDTAVWCYNAVVPGPEIRVRQGERLRIRVRNDLAEETTIHWHGVRTPNNMDGVPHLTQRPIGPGETFLYEFDAVDAGTFWYHPHQRSFEQVGRGLAGALVIEEAEPIRVDRDVTWMLDDWRLMDSGQIRDDFGDQHDMSHNGRVGNTVTINGRVPGDFAVRAGERIRLRLINTANARIFSLDFSGIDTRVIALDGQPVEPHAPSNGSIVLGPAMRADLILDMTGTAGDRIPILDRFYVGLEYRLIEIVYAAKSIRARAPDWPVTLPGNPVSDPDVTDTTCQCQMSRRDAIRHDVVFNGGMMGDMVMQEMGSGSMSNMTSMMEMMHSGNFWSINGVAATGHVMDPMLTLERGRSYVLAMTNETAWHHPIHLHGHAFRVIARNAQPTQYREWQDTVLMAPRERVEIAFVADNPGDWMFHCHILEHQAAGMMGVFRVA